jgi:hypothetical protein
MYNRGFSLSNRAIRYDYLNCTTQQIATGLFLFVFEVLTPKDLYRHILDNLQVLHDNAPANGCGSCAKQSCRP